MTGKRQRKLRKRIRIASVRAVQNTWIRDAFGTEAQSRRERDRLFAAACAKPDMDRPRSLAGGNSHVAR